MAKNESRRSGPGAGKIEEALHHQIWWIEAIRQSHAPAGLLPIRRAVVPMAIEDVGGLAEQLAGAPLPGKRGELVDGGDQEGRQAAIDHVVDSQQGQVVCAARSAPLGCCHSLRRDPSWKVP